MRVCKHWAWSVQTNTRHACRLRARVRFSCKYFNVTKLILTEFALKVHWSVLHVHWMFLECAFKCSLKTFLHVSKNDSTENRNRREFGYPNIRISKMHLYIETENRTTKYQNAFYRNRNQKSALFWYYSKPNRQSSLVHHKIRRDVWPRYDPGMPPKCTTFIRDRIAIVGISDTLSQSTPRLTPVWPEDAPHVSRIRDRSTKKC